MRARLHQQLVAMGIIPFCTFVRCASLLETPISQGASSFEVHIFLDLAS